jgi:membrane associated rhomboid family serine protease
MLCALIGLLGVVLVRVVLIRTGIDSELPVPVLVYLSLWVAITLAVWLAWLA